jgi:transcription elongation GreA/GreB family factor
MSRAFVKESDGDTEALPDRPISAHPNFVTTRGLAQLETQVRELEAARAEARAQDDHEALARIGRELRYFVQRRDSARLVVPAANPQTVRFGVRVMLRSADQSERRFRMVGEDEADPNQGLLSYVSPLAQSLIGLHVGDTIQLGGQTAVIEELDI